MSKNKDGRGIERRLVRAAITHIKKIRRGPMKYMHTADRNVCPPELISISILWVRKIHSPKGFKNLLSLYYNLSLVVIE